MGEAVQDILYRLRQEILPLEGYKTTDNTAVMIGCPAIEQAFPNSIFPTAAVHEFLSDSIENATASAGFIAGINAALLQQGGSALWIGTSRTVFPAALAQFAIDPSKIIFIDVRKEQHALWTTEEALKCNGLTAVISELKDLNFTNSRRFQLAVEQSRATGFIIHHHKKTLGVNACVARWKITPVPSHVNAHLPGVLFPRWQVELLKVRNGQPTDWIIEWNRNKLMEVVPQKIIQQDNIHIEERRQVG